MSTRAVVSRIFWIAGGQPFLRRLSHIFGISHNLDSELGFSVFVSKDSKGYILYKMVSVIILLLLKSPYLTEYTHMVIEAATGAGAAGGLDIFPHPCGSKHVKLDLGLRIHSHPWLVVDLPVFFLELRSQIDEVVSGPVAPDSLSMYKAKLFSQGVLDKLYDGQARRSE